MSEQKNDQNEYISSAFDNEANELDIRRLLKAVDNSVDQSLELAQWAEYQQLSDTIQGRNIAYASSSLDFLSALNQKIEQDIKKPTKLRRLTQRYGRVLTQTSVAASIALVAALGVKQYQVTQLNSTEQNAIVSNSTLYSPAQYPAQFPVPVFNSQPVSQRSYSKPIQALNNKRLSTELKTLEQLDQLLLKKPDNSNSTKSK